MNEQKTATGTPDVVARAKLYFDERGITDIVYRTINAPNTDGPDCAVVQEFLETSFILDEKTQTEFSNYIYRIIRGA